MMASAVVAMCGTPTAIVLLKGSNQFITGGSRVHTSRLNYVGSQKPHFNRSIVRQAAREDDEGSEENEQTEQKEQKEETKTSFFTSTAKKDAELLADARQQTQSGEQMSREQYAALRRKIGGTYKDFFKDSIDVVGDYVEDGWVDKTCRVCKKDTSKEPRTKDSLGRYAHVACLENEKPGNFFTRLFGR
ncbi:unnamed protein product [Calypogeia fissa]